MDDLIEPQEWGMGHPLLGGVFYGLALDLEKHWLWLVSDTDLLTHRGILLAGMKSQSNPCFVSDITGSNGKAFMRVISTDH